MQIVIAINIFVVILAYLSQYNKSKSFFNLAFLIIFLTTAFRFNFGTDYANYHEIYNTIRQSNFINLISYDKLNIERGWGVLNYILKPIGFFGLIIVISAFLCYTYYSLIKKYVEPKYYWLAIFTYVFTFDIMWIQFSAIRQALAIAIFVHSVRYLNEKENTARYILLIIIAGMVHSSAYFMLPFLILKIEKIRENKKTQALIYAIFFGVMFYGKTYLSQLMELSSFVSGERYLGLFTTETNFITTITGSIAWSFLLFIILYYSKFQQKQKKIYFYIVSLYCLVYVFTPLVWLADRIGYYFIVFSIVVFPLIIKQEKRIFIRNSLLVTFISFILYRLTMILKLDWVIYGYSKYNTIFPEIF